MKQIEQSTGKALIVTKTGHHNLLDTAPEDEFKFDKQDVLGLSRDAVMQTRFKAL